MKRALRLVVSLGILGVLLAFFPWTEVKQAAGRLRGEVWLSVLLAFLAAHRLGVEKWRLLLNAGRSNLGRTDAVRWLREYFGIPRLDSRAKRFARRVARKERRMAARQFRKTGGVDGP